MADASTTIGLLGLAAQVEHAQFTRLAACSRLAPVMTQRMALARCAVQRIEACERLLERIAELGGDPDTAMWTFCHLLDGFDARTASSSWAERLLVPYLGYGVADDFCALAAGALDDESGVLVRDAMADQLSADLAVRELSPITTHDRVATARLTLWGRRLVGEALTVVQSALEAQPAMERLLGVPRGALFGKLTAEHSRRMSRLRLTA